jgi:hypothetical protein
MNIRADSQNHWLDFQDREADREYGFANSQADRDLRWSLSAPIPAPVTVFPTVEYSSYDLACDAFKERFGQEYANYYAVQPATWPAWIPQTYCLGGVEVSLTFAQHSYGVWDEGQWCAYDFWGDRDNRERMEMCMREHHYRWR